MQIIAISFEHKVFTEARSPREYRKLIRNKLKDWDYQALSDSEPEADEHDLEMTTVPHEPRCDLFKLPGYVATPTNSSVAALAFVPYTLLTFRAVSKVF